MIQSVFHRRQFIRTGVYGTMTMIPLLEWACKSKPVPDIPSGTWIEQMIHYLDEGILATIKGQVKDPSHPQYGGSPDTFDMYYPHAPAGLIQSLTCVYIFRSSSYYHDTSLIRPMILGIDFILRHQHADGTIDLLSTNFHSTPDLGFIVELLALAYKLLLQDGQQETMELREKLKLFLLKAGDALSVGGIHTPNHRWVVCMALARLNELFPNEKYVKRINQWLYEKIDIDADGQYNERSTSVYDPLTNRWLITIATLMNKPELYEPVRRNLDMTEYLIHPNGDLVTEMSRRQDQYSTAPSAPYIFSYHYMATHFNEEKYKVMAAWIKSKYGVKAFVGYLPYFLEDEKLWQEPKSDHFPLTKYEKYFEKSKLVRWRDGNTDATLVAQNSNLFTMQHGGIILQAVRCATAFFGKGQFIGDRMEKTANGYEVHQKLEGPYFQPYAVDSLPADGDWDKMPREKRPQSEVQIMEYTLKVNQVDHGFKLNFSLGGTEGVPVAIELSFKNNGEQLINTAPVPGITDAYFLKKETGSYKSIDQAMWIKGGLHQHAWTALRGALPKLNGTSIYLTGFTPFEHEVIISTQSIN